MKQKKFDLTSVSGQRLLILSDGKPGHVNQAIAFARILGCEYEVVPVSFNFSGAKALSYILDRCGFYWRWLFNVRPTHKNYAAVVSAGSATYYANRTLARQLSCPAIAIMFPRGYRLRFDLIVAQKHDHPPKLENVIPLPVNLSYSSPVGIVMPQEGEQYLGLIIGGDSSHGILSAERLKSQIDQILKQFPEHKVWLTTSRRTSLAVEEMLSDYVYDFSVFYSQRQINPIPDFLEYCDIVFITADSSSMISEAVANGYAAVEILPTSTSFAPTGKFKDMLDPLIDEGYVHLFDGLSGIKPGAKIDLKAQLFKYF